MGGTTSQQTSTSSSQPWSAQQPYLTEGFQGAEDIYKNSNPTYYPGSTVAPLTGAQNSALSTGNDFANSGGGLNTAINQNNNIASGNFGGMGDAVYQNIASQVMPSVNSQFEGSGRYGSDSHAQALATGLTNAYAPYASSMMNSALDRSGTLSGDQWNNINNQYQLGAQQQGQAQQETNDAVNRFNYNQNLPQLKLNQFQQNVGGNWGGQSQTSTPVNQPSIWSQLFGGGLGIAGLLG